MNTAERDLQAELADDIAAFSTDPLACMLYSFPWGEGDLESSEGPYEWQRQVANVIKEHLENPRTHHQPLRVAVASGNGIGKSAFVAMVSHWALSTFEDTKIVVTATTGTQLQTKTQPEISKWFRLATNAHWFDVKTKSITIRDVKHADTWRLDFITWDEHNPDAFLGLHNKRKRIVMICDESSGIADVIWDTIQRALTDKETEIIWLALGNPNHNQGRFAECFGSDKYRWRTFQIDSRSVPGTNKEEIQSWLEKYGEDSDYFRYSVRGEFPRGGADQFIPSDIVMAARRNRVRGFEKLPKLLTCDVARFGSDETVIGLRQGRKFQVVGTYRGIDTEMTAQHVIEFREQYRVDAVVVDDDGIGGAVTDHLRARGYREKLFPFHGGAEPADPQMYYNKRAECWGRMRDWLKDGAEIPDDPQLDRQLTSAKYFIARGKVRNGAIVLEAKEDLKKRGYDSPDRADALAMSFGVTIAPQPVRVEEDRPSSWSRGGSAEWMRG
jgi:hypothetical protein